MKKFIIFTTLLLLCSITIFYQYKRVELQDNAISANKLIIVYTLPNKTFLSIDSKTDTLTDTKKVNIEPFKSEFEYHRSYSHPFGNLYPYKSVEMDISGLEVTKKVSLNRDKNDRFTINTQLQSNYSVSIYPNLQYSYKIFSSTPIDMTTTSSQYIVFADNCRIEIDKKSDYTVKVQDGKWIEISVPYQRDIDFSTNFGIICND